MRMDRLSDGRSGASTPSRFTSAASAEDVLKSQTVGLVHLADFRKRRADALEQQDREAYDGGRSGTQTPNLIDEDGAVTAQSDTARPARKKKKTAPKPKGLLSFGDDDDDDDDEGNTGNAVKTKAMSGSRTPDRTTIPSRKLTPNPHSTLPAPRAVTKASLAFEVSERERLRKEFISIQERVKSTEIAIPFIFYDGSNISGGVVTFKKGDQIWLFLERARKIAAEKGVAGTGTSGTGMGGKSQEDSRKVWARVGVDDLLCVRGDVIVPHHYELYHFIANKVEDPARPGKLLFDYSGTVGGDEKSEEEVGLRDPKLQNQEQLEGRDGDPNYMKVVDRRWYEKNKHIFPASTWKEYKVGKGFEELAKGRKDVEGNAFFYS